jgi:hypothetical protein
MLLDRAEYFYLIAYRNTARIIARTLAHALCPHDGIATCVCFNDQRTGAINNTVINRIDNSTLELHFIARHKRWRLGATIGKQQREQHEQASEYTRA